MITNTQIREIVLQALEGTDIFPVDINVKPGNRILVEIDRLEGVTIDQCVKISRAVEKNLNRDTEDFELEVSSPGLTQPFKVKEQYFKNLGREIEVLLNNGSKLKGKLVSMNDLEIVIEAGVTIKPEGKKKKETVIEKKSIPFQEVKAAKVVINF